MKYVHNDKKEEISSPFSEKRKKKKKKQKKVKR